MDGLACQESSVSSEASTTVQRGKVSLDMFWLRDENLEDTENLPPPDVIADEITESPEAALEQFAGIRESLGGGEE